jgi:hypothetical protein
MCKNFIYFQWSLDFVMGARLGVMSVDWFRAFARVLYSRTYSSLATYYIALLKDRISKYYIEARGAC